MYGISRHTGVDKKAKRLWKSQWCVRYGTGIVGTDMDVVPKLPKYPVPASMSYRSYQSVRYRYGYHIELTEVSGTGKDVVPYLARCPVPVWISYRAYQSVRYRYRRRTEHAELSGAGIDVAPSLPKCLVPVLLSYRTYRSVRQGCWCRTGTGTGTGTDLGIYTGGICTKHMASGISRRYLLNYIILVICCWKGTLWIINWKTK